MRPVSHGGPGALAPGLTPAAVLEKFAAMQMVDPHVPSASRFFSEQNNLPFFRRLERIVPLTDLRATSRWWQFAYPPDLR